MGDNEYLHAAAIIYDFLRHWKEIARKEWPAYSNDLNPIKSVWDGVHDVCRCS